MNCPKCSFEVPPALDAASCPGCGVVFAKLSGEAAARPRPAPRARPAVRPAPASTGASGLSIPNVLMMSALFTILGVLGWQWWLHNEPSAPPATSDRPEASSSSSSSSSSGEASDPPRPPAQTGGSDPLLRVGEGPAGGPTGSSPGSGQVLVLPGFPMAGERVEVEAPPTPDVPELPHLNPETVNETLLERAKSLTREHPEVDWLPKYVVGAQFLLAQRDFQNRRYSEAIDWVSESEQWGAPAGYVAAFKAVAYAELQQWERAESYARAALGGAEEVDTANMYHIVGKAHYYREELDKAIAAFRAGLEIRDDREIRASLERALREAKAADGFERQRLSHFIVRYEGGSMEDTGRMVLDRMERSYSTLKSQLGFEPTEPVVVILYSHRSYRQWGPDWSAGLFDGKIRVPVQGLERLDRHVETTLHHELAHAFIHSKAGERCPRWLQEGVAEYVEGVRTEKNGKLLARALEQGGSLEHCVVRAGCDVRVFYASASSLVDYLVQTRGMGGLRDLLTAMGEGEDVSGALDRVVGKDELSFIRDWQHFIKRRYS